jgi:hypothetical protein
MTNIKDLLISKQEELISNLAHSIQFIHREIGHRKLISSSLEKDLFIIADKIEKATEELATLKAQIPDTTINRSYSKGCESCKGSGVISEPFPTTTSITRMCPACNGSGVVIVTEILASDTDYLNSCMEKANPNLSKIKDVDQELAEIRGGKDELKTGARIGIIGKQNSDITEALENRKSEIFIVSAGNHFIGTSYPELKPSDPFHVRMPILIKPLSFEVKDGQTSRRERRAKERKKSKQ